MATQNRFLILDIDSDDDEWHEGYGASRSLGTQQVEEDEEEGSAIESPLHQEIDKFNEKVHPVYQGGEYTSFSDNDNVDTREGGYKKSDEYMDRPNVEDDSCTTFELAHDAVNSGWTNCEKKEETGNMEINRSSVMMRKFQQIAKIFNQPGASWRRYFGHESWENKVRNK